jgi:putative transposase
MSFPTRKSLPHAVPPWVDDGAIYFFTQCLQDRTRSDLVQAETASALLAAVRNYHDRQIWFMHLFLLMPDHLHALVSFPTGQSMRVAWSSWKRYTAKATGVIWQRDFFEHRLRSHESWEQRARYIRENPVRKGLVTEGGLWPWLFEP